MLFCGGAVSAGVGGALERLDLQSLGSRESQKFMSLIARDFFMDRLFIFTLERKSMYMYKA